MDFEHSSKAQRYIDRLGDFMETHIFPNDAQYRAQMRALNPDGNWQDWQVSELMETLKAKARAAGLWNLFLPDGPAGLSVLDYAPLAEIMGRAPWSAEVFNCNAPDTGNMEVLHMFGTKAQKAAWLDPLLAGEIRSVFCMTEPDVASSDARNIAASIRQEGEEVVLDGRKWWTTGLGHPKARVAIFMGVSDPDAPPHEKHAMVLVPLDAKGVTIERMLTTLNDYDPPFGHGQVNFDNVRLPKENVILGLGKGFAIAQGRLGPGRIHHCMRCIGAAERALELMIERASARVAFGKPIIALGGNREKLADARIAIDQARLMTLHAAWKIDKVGAKAAMSEISAIKVIAPNMLQEVTDLAIQMHGGMGMSHDTPLVELFNMARFLRFADGPDEVHRAVIAKRELARAQGPGQTRSGPA